MIESVTPSHSKCESNQNLGELGLLGLLRLYLLRLLSGCRPSATQSTTEPNGQAAEDANSQQNQTQQAKYVKQKILVETKLIAVGL